MAPRATLACQLLLALCAVLAPRLALSGKAGYKPGDLITLYANKVGPFQNPTETYQYYNLPFCTPKEGKEYKTEDLGEVLEGDRLVTTPYRVKFRTDVENEVLCPKALGIKDLQKFRDAVKQDYYFQVRIGP